MAAADSQQPLDFCVKASLCDASTALLEKIELVVVHVAGDESPLATMRNAIAKAFGLETTAVTVAVTVGETEFVLTTDAAVRDVVSQAAGTELLAKVSKADRSATARQAFTVTEESTMATEALDLVFVYLIGQDNLLESLKQEIRGEFELMGPIDLTAVVDGEAVALSGDKALLGLLEHLRGENRSSEKITVTFKKTSAVASRELEVSARAEGSTVEQQFVFRYNPVSTGLVESLKQELRGELDLAPDEELELTATVDGEATSMASDAVFMDLLAYLHESHRALHVVVARKHREPVQSRQIECVMQQDLTSAGASFAFQYRLSEANLMEQLKREIRHELDLGADQAIKIFFADHNERVLMTADKTLREILSQNDATVFLQVEKDVQTSAAHSGARDIVVPVRHEDEEGDVTVHVNAEAPSLLNDFIAELTHTLDITGTVALLHTVGGASSTVETAEQLRSLLAQPRNGYFSVTTAAMMKPRTKHLTLVLEGDDAPREFKVDIDVDGTHARQVIRDALRAAAAREDYVVALVIEGQEVPLTNDSVTREAIMYVNHRAIVTIRDEVHVATRQVVRIECHYEPTNELSTFDFVFHIDQDAVLEALRQEVRGQFNIHTSTPLTLHCTVPPAPELIAVDSDQHFRQVVASDTPVSRIVLYAKEHIRIVRKTVLIRLVSQNAPEQPVTRESTYVVGQQDLLTVFRRECCDLLDNDSLTAENSKLVATVDGERVDMVADKQVEDIFDAHSGKCLEVELQHREPKLRAAAIEYECSFAGVQHRGVFHIGAQQTELLTALKQECRGEFEISPDAEITLLVSPDFTDDEIMLHNDVILRKVFDEFLRKTSRDPLKLHMELGHLTAAINALLACSVRLEGSYEAHDFALLFDSAEGNVLEKLRLRVREVLHLPREAIVHVNIAAPEDGESIPLHDDVQLESIVRNGFSGTLNLVAKLSNTQPTANLSAQARSAEIAAVCADLRDVIADRDVVTGTDLKPLFGTFLVDGSPLPDSDQFMLRFAAFVTRERPLAVDLLPSELEEWTAQWTNEMVFRFCHHCRNTIDMLVAVSPLSKTRRAIGSAFKAQSVNGYVSKEQLRENLIASTFVDAGDVDDVLAGYGSRLSEVDFSEIMMHFFAEHPNRIHTIFSIATVRRPVSAGKFRGSREVDTLRKSRLKLEVRHALDGLTPASLELFAEHHKDAAEVWFQELSYVVAALLRLPCADESRSACWAWLMTTCADNELASQLLMTMRNTTRSYAADDVVALVSSVLFSSELTPSLLLATSNVLSALAEWASRVAQLTCVMTRRPWPPIEAHPAPEPGRDPDSPPSKMHMSPPRTRLQPAPPVSPNRNIVQRYTYRMGHLSEGLNLSDRAAATPLTTLLRDSQNAATEPAKKDEPAPAAATTEPAKKDEPAPAAATTEPAKKDEPAPAAATTEPAKKDEPAPAAATTEPAKKDEPAPAAATTEPAKKDEPAPAAATTEPAKKDEPAPAAATTEPAKKDEPAPAAATTEPAKKDEPAPAAATTEPAKKDEPAPAAATTEPAKKDEPAPAAATTEPAKKDEPAPAAAATEPAKKDEPAPAAATTEPAKEDEPAPAAATTEPAKKDEPAPAAATTEPAKKDEPAPAAATTEPAKKDEPAPAAAATEPAKKDEPAPAAATTEPAKEDEPAPAAAATEPAKKDEPAPAAATTEPAKKDEPAPAAATTEPAKKDEPAPAAATTEPAKKDEPAPAAAATEPAKKDEPAPAAAATEPAKKDEPAPAAAATEPAKKDEPAPAAAATEPAKKDEPAPAAVATEPTKKDEPAPAAATTA
jgi:hypothetical protein